MTDQELLQAIGQVVEAKLDPVRQDICELKGSVQRLDGRMDRLELNMDRLDGRMDRLELNMDRLDGRMDQLELNMDRLDGRMDQLESRIKQLELGMDKLESRIKQLELGMDKLKNQTEELEEKVNGIRIYMDTEQKRTMNLLLEGQQALWDRFVPNEKYDPLKDRIEVLELVVKRHSQEIRELQLA